MMSWMDVLGRVSFSNCDPIFDGIDQDWSVLPAPPAWLTGHVLRKDCLTAPIPAADYALHHDELFLLPDLGIVSSGDVGSVLLFGSRPLESMRDIALPSDSSTSKVLLRWALKNRGLDPKFVDSGPDIDTMLEKCDGALLIGDRSLMASREYPDLVKLDLGREWNDSTGLPMVFGVFAARRDAPEKHLKRAYRDMMTQLTKFESNGRWRKEVISRSSEKLGFPYDRMEDYFQREVRNRMTDRDVEGLTTFLKVACEIDKGPEWAFHSE